MAANRQTYIHTHVCNAVTLVWGSLRLAPISSIVKLESSCVLRLVDKINSTAGTGLCLITSL